MKKINAFIAMCCTHFVLAPAAKSSPLTTFSLLSIQPSKSKTGFDLNGSPVQIENVLALTYGLCFDVLCDDMLRVIYDDLGHKETTLTQSIMNGLDFVVYVTVPSSVRIFMETNQDLPFEKKEKFPDPQGVHKMILEEYGHLAANEVVLKSQSTVTEFYAGRNFALFSVIPPLGISFADFVNILPNIYAESVSVLNSSIREVLPEDDEEALGGIIRDENGEPFSVVFASSVEQITLPCQSIEGGRMIFYSLHRKYRGIQEPVTAKQHQYHQ